MRLDTVVVDKQDSDIVNELENFWNNESLGIKGDNDSSTHEKFVDDIKLFDDRYEVKLPFNEGQPTLHDNSSLSNIKLFSLVNRLQQNGEIAQQYDQIINYQWNQGIVERVDENAQIELGNVRYLPHWEVLRPDKNNGPRYS